ncbi:metaxin-1-like isoform X2 [Rhopilema esculentum]|uniref:metaxin-1-like isoform X2 n=1 Tax=Rhopilema esculentum TaxID=499914 RepID=UPI0031E496DC
MELFCWEGEWGLPSIDIECLEVLAHLKFAETPAAIKFSRTPTLNKSIKSFPILKKRDGTFISGADDILNHLRDNDQHPDIGLSPQQYADIVSLKALVKDRIHPYITFCLWLDGKNFTEFSRPLYAKKCVFPLNFIIPGKLYNNAQDFINSTKAHVNTTQDQLADELYLEAVDSINLLETYLADKEFFFGSKPTSFDALIFAYLAPLVKAKLASTKLQNHVRACDNLTKFVSRILTRFFPTEDGSKDKTTPKHDGQSERSYDWILSVAIGSLVMTMYAANIGLLAKLRW